jgi:hypothetical protein
LTTNAVDRTTAYPITVAIRDRGGTALVASSQATASDAAPLVTGIPVRMTKGLFFAAPVAYIVEIPGAAAEPTSHYTATINWGDGTAATVGTIAAVPGGAWVVGSHTYAGTGPYTITVTVHDDGGAVVATTTSAYDPPAGPRHHGRRRVHHHGHHGQITHAARMDRPRRLGMPLSKLVPAPKRGGRDG